MNKIENYLGIANHDIQMANDSEELKSYVASILCEIDELQQENKQIKIQISAREEVCDRLESNWNKLKEIAKSQSDFKLKVRNKELWFEVDELLSKMHELEQGSDSNE